ncbi:MAG TPA: glycosyl hydrolase family 28-related protein [Chloroflexota bacterium]|nr:glycosyl hydrolase family 28-related protein [Chloroflexota bacterium]
MTDDANMAELQRRLDDLERHCDAIRRQLNADRPQETMEVQQTPVIENGRTSRRALLRSGLGLAAGAAGAAALFQLDPCAADAAAKFRRAASGSGNVAIEGDGSVGATGLVGTSDTGTGVKGTGAAGYGATLQGGTAPLQLVPNATFGAPAGGTHLAGEIVVDAAGTAYLCLSSGSPGMWQVLSNMGVDVRTFGARGDGVTDDTAAIQAALNTGKSPVIIPGGTYLISSQLNAATNQIIQGAGHGVGPISTVLKYSGTSTIPGGAMVRFDTAAYLAVRDVGFTCSNCVATNKTIQLYLTDCVYGEVSNVAFVGGGASEGTNRMTGLRVESTKSGQVPPRGQLRIADILYVVEPPGSGDSSDNYCIYVDGISDEQVHVVFEGEGDIEHAAVGIGLHNVTSCVIGPGWQIRCPTCIQLVNASQCIITGPEIAPTPQTGTGISIDSGSYDNLLINPGWNFSSGNPLYQVLDNGVRTVMIGSTFEASGSMAQTQKWEGASQHRKAPGIGPHWQLIKTAGDTSEDVIQGYTDFLPAAVPAYLNFDRGSMAALEFVRFAINGALRIRVDANGQAYVYAAPSPPPAGNLADSQITFYLDEVGNNLKVLVKYSNGTVKTGTVALS